MLSIGDRVEKDGFTWHGEDSRQGTIVRIYHGQPSANAPGILLADVRWDGHSDISLGFILDSGSLRQIRKEDGPKKFDVHNPPVRLHTSQERS
jgi:hypothetical protein